MRGCSAAPEFRGGAETAREPDRCIGGHRPRLHCRPIAGPRTALKPSCADLFRASTPFLSGASLPYAARPVQAAPARWLAPVRFFRPSCADLFRASTPFLSGASLPHTRPGRPAAARRARSPPISTCPPSRGRGQGEGGPRPRQNSAVAPKWRASRIAVSAVTARGFFVQRISPIRVAGTRSANGNALAERPSDFINSSRRTSPGWVRMRAIACPSVIIDDLDPFGALAPHKADAPLLIDPELREILNL